MVVWEERGLSLRTGLVAGEEGAVGVATRVAGTSRLVLEDKRRPLVALGVEEM